MRVAGSACVESVVRGNEVVSLHRSRPKGWWGMRRFFVVLLTLATILLACLAGAGPFQSDPAGQVARAFDPNSPVSWSEIGEGRALASGDSYSTASDVKVLTDSIGPLTVFPPDERWQVTPTTYWPARAIAYLQTVKQYTPSGYSEICTGTFVGPNVLLTAAHCLYDAQYGAATSIAVVPGRDGQNFPYSYGFASDYSVTNGWYYNADWNYDWGLIWGLILMSSSDLGNAVGNLTVGILSTNTLAAQNLSPITAGYPGDKTVGTQWAAQKTAFTAVLENVVQFTLDAYPGQSGSAIRRGADNLAVAVMSMQQPSYNQGARLTQGMLDSALSWCSSKGCSISYYVEPIAAPTPTRVPIGTPAARVFLPLTVRN